MDRVSAAFDQEFRDRDEDKQICIRCGKAKEGVKKRPNHERLCECCWSALSQEPPARQGPMTGWDV